MSALSVNQSVPGYRRASLLEAMAVHVGAGLVEWAERRRDELNLLRGDVLGAAHSGLLLPRR